MAVQQKQAVLASLRCAPVASCRRSHAPLYRDSRCSPLASLRFPSAPPGSSDGSSFHVDFARAFPARSFRDWMKCSLNSSSSPLYRCARGARARTARLYSTYGYTMASRRGRRRMHCYERSRCARTRPKRPATPCGAGDADDVIDGLMVMQSSAASITDHAADGVSHSPAQTSRAPRGLITIACRSTQLCII